MKFETPASRAPWLILFVLFVAWVGCICTAQAQTSEPPVAQGPDYVTTFGISVYDPAHHSFAEEVDVWALMTLVKAPDEDREALIEIFAGMTLVIHAGPRIVDPVYPCGLAPSGSSLLGCANPFSWTINIAWRPCEAAPMSSAGIFAHESGHLVTFTVRGYVGHDDPKWFGPDQAEMARRVSEPICRMGK
jgi:hypothetical protein